MKISSSSWKLKHRRAAAFSLIEVVVAASVIVVSFVGIFGSLTLGLNVTQLSRENLRATQIMLDKMEGLRLYNWTQVNNTNFLQSSFTNWFYETNSIGQATASGTGVQYNGSVVVAAWPFVSSYGANMRQVTVMVNWTSENINRSRSMVTFVNLSGLQNYVFND